MKRIILSLLVTTTLFCMDEVDTSTELSSLVRREGVYVHPQTLEDEGAHAVIPMHAAEELAQINQQLDEIREQSLVNKVLICLTCEAIAYLAIGYTVLYKPWKG